MVAVAAAENFKAIENFKILHRALSRLNSTMKVSLQEFVDPNPSIRVMLDRMKSITKKLSKIYLIPFL
jgi:hypothetical protein